LQISASAPSLAASSFMSLCAHSSKPALHNNHSTTFKTTIDSAPADDDQVNVSAQCNRLGIGFVVDGHGGLDGNSIFVG